MDKEITKVKLELNYLKKQIEQLQSLSPKIYRLAIGVISILISKVGDIYTGLILAIAALFILIYFENFILQRVLKILNFRNKK
jgi:hypothetical protein